MVLTKHSLVLESTSAAIVKSFNRISTFPASPPPHSTDLRRYDQGDLNNIYLASRTKRQNMVYIVGLEI